MGCSNTFHEKEFTRTREKLVQKNDQQVCLVFEFLRAKVNPRSCGCFELCLLTLRVAVVGM